MYKIGDTLVWTRVTENNVARFRCVVLEMLPGYAKVQFLDRWGRPQPDDVRSVYLDQLSKDHVITPPPLQVRNSGPNPQIAGIVSRAK